MFSLASLEVETSDTRRKIAAKFAAKGPLPADAAAAATLLTIPHRHRRPDDPASVPMLREVDLHPSGLPAWRRLRVLMPFVEPNVHSWLRTITLDQAPHPVASDDGILTTTWSSVGQHAQATREAYEFYLRTHSLLTEAPRMGMVGPDSWHSPLALVPVRHTYADGSAERTAWVSADGTARVFAARRGLAQSISAWIGDHPWTDPGGLWPLDVVTLRDTAARARRKVTEAGGDPGNDWWAASPWLVDWADMVLAPPSDPADFEHKIGLWAFLEHRGPVDEPTEDDYEQMDFRTLLTDLGDALGRRDTGGGAIA